MFSLGRRSFIFTLGSMPLWPIAARPVAASKQGRMPIVVWSYLAGLPYHPGYVWYQAGHIGLQDFVELRAEPSNMHDANAIEVWHHRLNVKLGYVPRHMNAQLAEYLRAGEPGMGMIIRRDYREGPWRGVAICYAAGEGMSVDLNLSKIHQLPLPG